MKDRQISADDFDIWDPKCLQVLSVGTQLLGIAEFELQAQGFGPDRLPKDYLEVNIKFEIHRFSALCTRHSGCFRSERRIGVAHVHDTLDGSDAS